MSAQRKAHRANERYLATVLMTDIVGSTERSAELGDAAWRDLVNEHHRIVRSALRRQRGREVDTAGDGFFALFDAPGAAVHCALDAIDALRTLGIEIRAGIHVGEVEEIAGKAGGISVPIAARIMAAAAPGEVLVSSTARDLAAGSGLQFADRGARELKGVPGEWHVYDATREADAAGADHITTQDGAARRAAAVRRLRGRPIWQRRPRLAAALAVVLATLFATAGLLVWKPWQPPALAGVAENAIGLIDVERGVVVGQIPVGARPGGMAAADGLVWVTNTGANNVSVIDVESRAVVDTIEVGRNPSGVAIAGGSAWVANGGERTVSRVNVRSRTVVDEIPVGNGPVAIAAGAGALWVANAVDSTVVRIDPETGATGDPIPVTGRPSALAAGEDGVWVVSEDIGTLTHLDATSGVALSAPIPVGIRPSAVAIGGGSVWVANADGIVARIDPAGHRVTGSFQVGTALTAIVASGDSVWTADAEGAVHRFSVDDPSAATRVDTQTAAQALADVGGAIWVATRPSLEAHRGGTLRVVLSFPPLSLDPVDVTLHPILALEADGLLGYRRVGGIGGSTLMPALAQSIPTPAAGGTEYTFRLRPDLVYSDGTPVRATDFRRAIERLFQVAEPFSGLTSEFYFTSVRGAEGCPEPPVERCDLSEGIVTDDEAGTVIFRLTAPDSEFLYKLAMPFAYPVAESVPMNDLVMGAFPGTGPYTVASFSETELRLIRNPHFRSWDPDVRPDGFADEIVHVFGIEPERQAEMVAAGDADYMLLRFGNRVGPDTLANLRATYTSQLHLGSVSTLTVFMNPAIPPFDSLEVRQAVSFALERRAVADSLGGGIGANITCQILPPAWPGYQPYCPYTRDADAGGEWHGPDLAGARRLVDASGTAGTPVTVGPMTERYGPIAERLVSTLNAIGFEATLDPATDVDTVYGALSEGRIGIGVLEWLPDVVAPATFLAGFTCDESHGLPEVCDEELDALVAEARALQTTDAAAAVAKWAEVDRFIVDQAFWAPLFNDGADFVSARVGNYQFHPAYFVLLDQLWVR